MSIHNEESRRLVKERLVTINRLCKTNILDPKKNYKSSLIYHYKNVLNNEE